MKLKVVLIEVEGYIFEAPLCTLLEEFQMQLFNGDVETNRFLTSASTFVCSERHAGVHPVHWGIDSLFHPDVKS